MLYSLLHAGEFSWTYFFLLLVSYAALVLVMLPLHECAHGAVACWLGDRTAKWYGRLTLNPKKHLDPIGTVMLVLVGFGYAKPVPVNPYQFRKMKPKGGMALVALAGPLSNLLLAFLSLLLFRLILLVSGDGFMVSGGYLYFSSELTKYAFIILVEVFAGINIGLAVFNLLPIPPLDGSRILAVFLPDRFVELTERYSRFITLAVFFLLMSDVLDRPIYFLRHALGGALCFITGLPNLF